MQRRSHFDGFSVVELEVSSLGIRQLLEFRERHRSSDGGSQRDAYAIIAARGAFRLLRWQQWPASALNGSSATAPSRWESGRWSWVCSTSHRTPFPTAANTRIPTGPSRARSKWKKK